MVATPIGNLEDITFRAVRTLKEVDRIACEDTRVAGKLLAHYGITTPLLRHDAHNEIASSEGLMVLLSRGETVALISDAGTPCISDPGGRLINDALEAGLKVCAIPGPSALAAALSVGALPAEGSTFHGFLPKRRGPRVSALSQLSPGTHVVYHPARALRTLVAEFAELWPDSRLAIGRELTKQFETWYRGTPSEVLDQLDSDSERGEAVLLAHLMDRASSLTDKDIIEAAEELLRSGTSKRDAAAEVSLRLGLPKRQVYQLLVGQE